QVAARFAGNANYNQKQSAPATIKIERAHVRARITSRPRMHNSQRHAATVVLNPAISGYSVNHTGAATAYSSSSAPANADAYTVTVTITDSNYVLSGPGTGSITIGKADPAVTATGNTCTYNGSPCAGNG